MDTENHIIQNQTDGELHIDQIFDDLLESITQGFTPEEKQMVSEQITDLFNNPSAK